MTNQKTLSIEFNPADLPLLNQAGLKVVLIKDVENGGSNVCWGSYTPYERQTFIWDPVYQLFVSPDKVVNRNTITATSRINCLPGHTYISRYNSLFVSSENDTKEPYIKVENDNVQDYLTFGLAQSLTYNNNETKPLPINAITVPKRLFASFYDSGFVYVLLATDMLQSQILTSFEKGGLSLPLILAGRTAQAKPISRRDFLLAMSAIPVIAAFSGEARANSQACYLDFNKNTEITLRYFSNIGKFVPMVV